MRASKLVSFSVVILLITVVFAGFMTVPAAAQYDTMMFRYNAEHTGDYSAVAGSTPSNGKLLWNYTTRGVVDSDPAVANGIVYVRSDGYNPTSGAYDWSLYAFNGTSGTELWNYTRSYSLEFGISSPAAANGIVYIGGPDGYDSASHSFYYKLYALNSTSGTELWNYTPNLAPGFGISSPAVANGAVYFGSGDNLYAIDAASGTKLWNYTIAAVYSGVGSPAVANGVVYFGSEHNLYAIDATSGTKLWNYTTGYFGPPSPVVVNGVVYVATESAGPEGACTVYAIHATSGTELWNDSYIYSSYFSSLAVANGVIYVQFNDGKLYALNGTTGAQNWNYTTGSTPGPDWDQSAPAVANGVVYVGSYDHNIYAVNATDGSKLWNYTTGDSVVSSPAVANGVVYVGSYDHNIYAIGNELIAKRTTLDVSAPSLATVNQNFTINGTLNTADGTAIAGATIQLQKNASGSWQNVTTNVTNATGGYQFSKNESTAGTYYYRAAYDGNDTYPNATSNSVSVNVVNNPPVTVGAPAVSAQNASGLDLFVRNATGATWWEELNGGKVVVPWTSLGGVGTADPAATSPANGVINVFVRGSDGALWEKTTTNGGASWPIWTSLGGQLTSGTGPGACSVSGRMDVFVQGTDRGLWHKSYTSTWSGWQSLGGKLTSSPAAARAPGSSRIDVVGRGGDGALWSRTSTNGGSSWSGWTSLGGKLAPGTGPAVSSWSSIRVDAFVVGTDNALWHKSFTGTWSGWASLGSPQSKALTSSPAAVSPGSNMIDVVARGGDNGLWQMTYNSGWSGWALGPT